MNCVSHIWLSSRQKSEIQLQAELNDPHWKIEAANLAHLRHVRRYRRRGAPPDVVGRPELRRVECVERFRAELQPSVLPQRLDGKILVQGQIDGFDARPVQNVRS